MADSKERARGLARDLAGSLGGRLNSVLLFGSVARGEAIEGVSDVNVMVVLDHVDAATLRLASPHARRWAKGGNTAPLIFGAEEVSRAADAFAIEFSDMIDAHEVLHGGDPLSGFTMDSSAMRLQAEREIRGKVVQLRQGLLLSASDATQTGRLLARALPSFATYHRAILRLRGETVPSGMADVITAAAKAIGAEPDPFLRVLASRSAKKPLALRIDDPIVEGYYSLADKTAAYVDTFTENSA